MNDSTNDVLEQNVSHLIESGGEAPRLDDAARLRIRDGLVAKFAVAPAPRAKTRVPLFAVGLGLAATAAIAVVATHFIHAPGAPAAIGQGEQKLADGTTYIAEPGAKVAVLGPRKVRIEGAVLLDVAPGKGTFVVETARGTISVLGTRFVVEGTADQTSAAVVRGEVKLASSAGEVLLHAGEQGIATPGKAPVRGPAPRLSHLVSWAQQARHIEEKELPVHHGTLFARDPGVRSHPPWGEEYPLPIKQLTVDITVEDQVARVALDQTFHNNTPQVLEGVYRFAIPPDAALQRLAMYVDGKLTESAVVERMRARRIYEELVYRRVDPALLEWAGTGRLSLRVYPLPALEDKRLMLAYTQSLPKLYDDYTITVPLPEVDEAVGSFDVAVKVKGCANCELVSTSHPITTERSGDDATVKVHRENVKLGDSFVLHVRDTRHRTTVATANDAGDKFVLVRAPVELGTTAKVYKPRTWIVLDDVSASRSTPELRAQRDLIDAFVKELDENDKLGVIAFDVQARTKLEPTRVMDVDKKALHKALAHEGGVGATDFESALAAATAALQGVDPDQAMVVYLGDGMITSGARTLDTLRAELAGKAHFIGVGVGDGPDTQTLDALAAATGGYATTFDLADDLGWRAFDLVAALHTSRVTGLEARLVDDKGTLVPATTYLAAPQLADGEELELVAKLASDKPATAVELTGTLDGAVWKQTIRLGTSRPDAAYLPRLWAQRHIAARLLAKHEAVELTPCAAKQCPTEAEARETRDEQIRREVVGLGKKYFLLSRHTSLLVLENDAMYKQYDVQKGAGDTWAPYAMPATIPIVRTVAPTVTNVAADAELVRSPVQRITSYGGYDGYDRWTRDTIVLHANAELARRGAADLRGFDSLAPQGSVAGPTTGSTAMALDEGKMGKKDSDKPDLDEQPAEERQHDAAENKRKEISTDELDGRLSDDFNGEFAREIGGGEIVDVKSTIQGITLGGQTQFGHGAGGGKSIYWGPSQLTTTLAYPLAQPYTDLSAFVPALFDDGADRLRRGLGVPATHAISDAARALLAEAHKQVPAGIYRWGDRELAVDADHRLGWRRTTDDGLVESAGYDGTLLTRRYGELGLDVVRPVASDDIVLGLVYLPVWIADPAHYAQYFDVSAKGRDVILSTTVRGASVAMYVLSLDAQARLVAITDANGKKLLEIGWGATGPMAAKVNGETIACGFTAQAVADAGAWAHAGAQPGVIVELPGHLLAYWNNQLQHETVGTPAWRRAQRQRIVAAIAQHETTQAYDALVLLRDHGGAELGDLVLASAGLATAADDDHVAQILTSFPRQPVAAYIAAGRAYMRRHTVPAELQGQATAGFVGALAQARLAVAQLAAQDSKAAAATLDAMPATAPELRLAVAAASAQAWQGPVEPLIHMWESVATGSLKNVARLQAAQVAYNHNQYDLAADKLVALVDQLDLDATPAAITQLENTFNVARRGQAGWQMLYAAWRTKVLAGASYPHVMALLQAAVQHGDLPAVLARAAELAGDDTDKQLELVRTAIAYGQPGWAKPRLQALIAKTPTRAIYQLAAQVAQGTGDLAEALTDLERAQDLTGDERVTIQTIRVELGQIVGVAQQLALQQSGPDRQRTVDRALAWGEKWRAVDPGNPQIDTALGEMLLAINDQAGAWRQLSTVIEREPWSGAGYMTVADTFERRGKVADALPYWQQAIVIDQTNPTPRLRKAQALIALGQTREGDQLLHDITSQKWHDIWSNVVYQAQELERRTK